MNVLMVGATGSRAGAVLPELVKRGAAVRALVRDEERAAVARRRGASETVIADLADPASLRAAVAGVDGVFHVNPAFAPREADMGVAMVDAAKAAGVRKFVFSGVLHPSISSMVNHAAKQPVEEALYTSGMEYTVLQPAMFMQGPAAYWPEVVEYGKLSMPYSISAKTCWVDLRDVAEVAALALTGDELAYGTFELCAPGMVDRVQLAAMISGELGRPVEAAQTPLGQWASHFPEGHVRDGLTRMMAHYDEHGFPGGNAIVLRAILGREPRSLKQYIHQLATNRPE
jgi:uncharacterized protein YbjT (DUF2867 family)